MAAISAEGDTALHPPRRRGGAIKPRRRAICSPRCSRRCPRPRLNPGPGHDV